MRGATRAAALLITLALATGVAGPLGAGPAVAATGPRIGSTFLDPRATLAWDDTRWDEEVSSLATAGIHDIVLQASADLVDGRIVTYFPTSLPGTAEATRSDGTPVDVVHALLTRAEAAGMTVWIGLLRDLRATRFAPDGSIDGVLQQDASDTTRIADALAAEVPTASPMAGWYLPAEINTNYVAEPARDAAMRYFAALAQHLHASDGGHPVMTAPYFSAHAGVTASQWQQFWTVLLRAAPLDVVALQDGTGDIPGRPRDPVEVRATLRQWFGALRRAVATSGGRTQLWAALDLYDFTGATAVIADDAAHRAAIAGIVSGFTSFSFTDQISPWTLGTSAYLTPFARWNLTGSALPGKPSPPTHVRVQAAGPGMSIRWRPSRPARGKEIAYYRVLLVLPGHRTRYVATVWPIRSTARSTIGWTSGPVLSHRQRTCFVVTAYDTTGDASRGARACSP